MLAFDPSLHVGRKSKAIFKNSAGLPTCERPSANDCTAEASSMANPRNEDERLKAADSLMVGVGIREYA